MGDHEGGRRGRNTKRRKTTEDPKTNAQKVETPKYNCDYCRKDITNVVRVMCAECVDFDLCVECFSVGVEVDPHKNTHSYRVMDKMDYAILEADWVASEELLLLEGIDSYGYGNWQDISDHVGSKSRMQCIAHYEELLLKAPGSIPNTDVIVPAGTSLRKWNQAHPDPNDMAAAMAGANDANMPKSDKPQGSTKRPRAAGKKGEAKTNSAAELAGYYPCRQDFDTEHDNDIEQMIMDMEFESDDDELDTELKLTVLQIYNSILDERMARKTFVFDRDMTDNRKFLQMEKKTARHKEKEVTQRMRVFARHHSEEEHMKLLEGLLEEQSIRRRIEELQEYRRNGITSLAEGKMYEEEKKRREREKQMKKAGHGYTVGRGTRFLREKESDVAIAEKDKRQQRKSAPMDISACVGVELLSEREKSLCGAIRLLPSQYQIIKSTLLKEHARVNGLKRVDARRVLKIDVNKTSKIYDFFQEMGWINPSTNLTPVAGAAAAAPVVQDESTPMQIS